MRYGLIDACDGDRKDADYLARLAPAVERAGFASLWFPEHIVFLDAYESDYPYAPTPGSDQPHRLVAGPDQGTFDPFLACLAAALHTRHLRVGTGIALLAPRHPLVVAKELATLDHLSGGRFDLGIGVGWLKEEFDALGVPFHERGRMTDEHLAVLRRVWTERRPTFAGAYYHFDEVVSFPKPVQQPHPPILVGGESAASLRRVAELGDGWYPWNQTPDQLGAGLERLDDALARVGRDRKNVKIQAGLVHRGPLEDLVAYADAVEALGVEELVVTLRLPVEGIEERVAEVGEALALVPA
jgi:probable F420-dependent oxidoreductase